MIIFFLIFALFCKKNKKSLVISTRLRINPQCPQRFLLDTTNQKLTYIIRACLHIACLSAVDFLFGYSIFEEDIKYSFSSGFVNF